MVSHQAEVNGAVGLDTGLQAEVGKRIRREAAVLAGDRTGPPLDKGRGRYGGASQALWRGPWGLQGLLLSPAPSVHDGPVDGCPVRGDEGLQVGRPGPSGGEQSAGLLEDDPIVNATASGHGREPLDDVREVV